METKDALQWAFAQPVTIVILILFIVAVFWYFKKEMKEQKEEFKETLQQERSFWQKECEKRDKMLNESMTNLIDLNKLTNETWHTGMNTIRDLKNWLEHNFKK